MMHSFQKHFHKELNQLGLDIYRIDLEAFSDDEIESQYKILDEDEKARASRLISSLHRKRYITAHAALRHILGQHLNISPNEILFGQRNQQKPTIAYPSTNIEFNLSHSENLAMLVVGPSRFLGIDVERVRKLSDAGNILESCLTEREYKIVGACTSLQALTIWTLKEAVVKATGEGLFRPLNSVEFATFPPSDVRLNTVDGLPPTEKWSVATFQPHVEYIASVAVA